MGVTRVVAGLLWSVCAQLPAAQKLIDTMPTGAVSTGGALYTAPGQQANSPRESERGASY